MEISEYNESGNEMKFVAGKMLFKSVYILKD